MADPDVLESELSDWLPSLYIDPRPSSTFPQFQYCYRIYIVPVVEYILYYYPRDCFELAPRFLWTSANSKSTTGAATFQNPFMDVLSISLVETLSGL